MSACANCGHPEESHRSGGLCEACMPPGDATGRWSSCQMFARPLTLPSVEGLREQGAAAERARLREKVEAMRRGAITDRTRAFDMEWAKDHAKLSERCGTLAEVLALLAEPGETPRGA